MLQRLRALLAALLSSAAPSHAKDVRAPVDLNTAVENPSLVRAMEEVASSGSDSSKDKLLIELQRANLLAAILPDANGNFPAPTTGKLLLPKGTRFGVLSAGKDGKNYLVLFSDWSALVAYTELQVKGWVLPARDAWKFALEGNTYNGVVINPAHNALPLERPMLEYLRAHSAQ